MSIRYFDSTPSIDVETPDELFEAIDILHTQVMDNFGLDAKSAPFLKILETAMNSLMDLPAAEGSEGQP